MPSYGICWRVKQPDGTTNFDLGSAVEALSFETAAAALGCFVASTITDRMAVLSGTGALEKQFAGHHIVINFPKGEICLSQVGE
ncbi:MAG: hypothetical protein A2927_02840 [Candidatus Komeilibacteria bacterium RIFCSPLOWO2_01_FULL_45_10]|uniref:Uncharacterized protein n=1 Tax=Candidatus Komeilibacteria bacterium RIFCSPLOWO2_01_FULL_45_10 TaxID=1798550 RepID=A0A1G2BI40_9BACT|nr:MAG: hypothetical protein A2927_02840 [Candidatus Komeilibacteria bacterium RIFCSPLOWO2_01_FULL_45_10]